MANNNKRKIQVKPADTVAKKPKYWCEYCHVEYKNYGCLSSHYTEKHKGTLNKCSDDPRLFVNRLGNNEKELFETKEQCRTLQNDNTNLRIEVKKLLDFKKAELGLSRDRDIDKKKGRFLRFSGFEKKFFYQWYDEKNEKPLKKVFEDEMELFIRFKISSTLYFEIVRTIPKFHKNSVSVTVEFSARTDTFSLFKQLMDFFKSDQNERKEYHVSTLTSPGTEIRMAILYAIGKKIVSQKEGKIPKVYFKDQRDYKLYFSVTKKLKDNDIKREEVQFNDKYINAIERYGSLMKPENYLEAAKLCRMHQIKDEDLDQFLVEFPRTRN